jgi:hypothetical protein
MLFYLSPYVNTACFGCNQRYTLRKREKNFEWICKKCDSRNFFASATGLSIPSEHHCTNQAYCPICVGNSTKLNRLLESRKKKFKFNASQFCARCIHNQTIVMTLLSNDPPNVIDINSGIHRPRI